MQVCREHSPTQIDSGKYDAQDRMLSYAGAQYFYTANGDLREKIAGTDTTTYSYDAFGNLTKVVMPNGDVIQYVIDGQNRRIGKKVNGKWVEKFLYAGQLTPVAELDSADNVIARFSGGYMNKRDTIYQIITDHLGSPRLVVNVSTGAVVQRIDYDEFGNVIYDSNSAFQPFGFAGGLYDSDTKLVRFGARDYDARTGRWTSKDPIGFGGLDCNLYRYGVGDPIGFVDPDGHFIPLLAIGAGAAVGAVIGGGIYAITTNNFSWQGLAGAAAGGAIAGGVGAVAAPLAGWLGLGTGILGTAAVNAGGGALAAAATSAIDPCQEFSIGYVASSALWGGVGGSVAAKAFPTMGMSNFNQIGFPRTMSGLTPTFLGGNMGRNATAIYRGAVVATAVSAVGATYVH